MTKYGFCVAAVIAAWGIGPAQAEDCPPLKSYGTLPLTEIAGDSREFVPVEIAGSQRLMIVDTGDAFTTMSGATADDLKLDAHNVDLGLVDVTGSVSSRAVSAPLKVGNIQFPDAQFILDTHFSKDPHLAGLLGANIYRSFDLSIDFGAHTLAFFSQDHCDGHVLYWPERPVAVIPFKLQDLVEVILHVNLDGQDITAQLDTGASNSTLEKSTAERLFDIVPGSADTPLAGDLNGKKGLSTWKHRFKTLSLAGVEMSNPGIDIIPDVVSDQLSVNTTGTMLDRMPPERQAPMLLGMNLLRHLHIYIAYKEKKLYITPAGQPAASQPAAVAKPN